MYYSYDEENADRNNKLRHRIIANPLAVGSFDASLFMSPSANISCSVKNQEYIYNTIRTIQAKIPEYAHYFYIPEQVKYIRLGDINTQKISNENIGLLVSEKTQGGQLIPFLTYLDTLNSNMKKVFFYHGFFHVLFAIKLLDDADIKINNREGRRKMEILFDLEMENVLINIFGYIANPPPPLGSFTTSRFMSPSANICNDYKEEEINRGDIPELKFLAFCQEMFNNKNLRALSATNIETIVHYISEDREMKDEMQKYYSRYKNWSLSDITQDIQKWQSTWFRYIISRQFLDYYYGRADLQTEENAELLLPILLKNTFINPEKRIL